MVFGCLEPLEGKEYHDILLLSYMRIHGLLIRFGFHEDKYRGTHLRFMDERGWYKPQEDMYGMRICADTVAFKDGGNGYHK